VWDRKSRMMEKKLQIKSKCIVASTMLIKKEKTWGVILAAKICKPERKGGIW
jgi:hypothetical protein